MAGTPAQSFSNITDYFNCMDHSGPEIATFSAPIQDEIAVSMQGMRHNLFLFSLFFTISGISGTVYFYLALHYSYGPWAFLLGTETLLPKVQVGLNALATQISLFLALAFSMISFMFLSRKYSEDPEEIRASRAGRIGSFLFVISFAELLFVLLASVITGFNQNNSPTIVFGTGNMLESVLFVLGILFLFSFLVFTVSGLVVGIFWSLGHMFYKTKRYELIIISLLVLTGVFFYPAAIFAGALGLFVSRSREPLLAGTAKKVIAMASVYIEKHRFGNRAYSVALGFSIAVIVLILYIVSLTLKPLVSGNNAFGYFSPVLTGNSGVLIMVGLTLLTSIASLSCIMLLRSRPGFGIIVVACSYLSLLFIMFYLALQIGSSSYEPNRFAMFITFPISSMFIGLAPSIGVSIRLFVDRKEQFEKMKARKTGSE